MTPTLSERARELVEWLSERVDWYASAHDPSADAVAARFKSRAETVSALLAEREWRAPEGWVLVPEIPTEEMWGGLARWIVLWARTGPQATGASLYAQLRATGEAIPSWLYDEIRDNAHVPPKGDVATVIWRAMIDARPNPTPPNPNPAESDSASVTVKEWGDDD